MFYPLNYKGKLRSKNTKICTENELFAQNIPYICNSLTFYFLFGMGSIQSFRHTLAQAIQWLENFFPRDDISAKAYQRTLAYVYISLFMPVGVVYALFSISGPHFWPLLLACLFYFLVQLTVYVLFWCRKIEVATALSLSLIFAQVALSVESVLCIVAPTARGVMLIAGNMALSVVWAMLAVAALLPYVPLLISLMNMLVFTGCMYWSDCEALHQVYVLYVFVTAVVCVLGERLVRHALNYENANTGLKKRDYELLFKVRPYRTQVQALADLLKVSQPKAHDMELFFAQAGDTAKRKLVSALTDYLNEQNLCKERLAALFPEMTPSELDVIRLVIEGKKQGEICAILNKTENNVVAHRGHIRKKLLMTPDENLRDVLLLRMEVRKGRGVK